MNGGSYIEFFFPGLLAYTAMFVPFVESTYGNFTKLNYQKTYSTIMLTRVSPEEIVLGEMFWTASKGFFGTCGMILVASFFGLIDSWRIFPALFILFAVSWLFSGFGMIVTTMVKNYDQFVYFMSGVIIPMSLIAGIYFPLEQLPDGIRHAAWVLPLTHAVAAIRALLSRGFSWPVGLHFALLLLMGWIVMNIAVRRLRTILVK
jgi:lipooligosaccharide transport system permease protein